MRKSRVVKVALPFLAVAASVGGAVAPAASARTPHLCGATPAFAKNLQAFEKTYDKGAAGLGQPKGKTLQALAAYLEHATKFFDSATQKWAEVGKSAPSSVKTSFNNSVTQLKKTTEDFGAAAKDVKSGNLTAMEKDVTKAEKDANGFASALKPLITKCA